MPSCNLLSTEMLVVRIANETDLPEEAVRRIILCLSDEMRTALLRREVVTLEGFGTLFIKDVLTPVSVPDQDADARPIPGSHNNLPYRPFKPETEELRLLPRVFLDADPAIKEAASKAVNPTGDRAPYQSRLFSAEECEEIKRQIASGEATIKGTARTLKVERDVIRNILRGQNRRRSKPRYQNPNQKGAEDE